MSKKKLLIWVTICASAIVLLFVFSRRNTVKYSSELNRKMNCVVDNIDIYGLSFADKCDFSYASNMGLEVKYLLDDRRKDKTQKFSLNISSAPKWKILNEIVQKNPEYYWEEKDGVVNIRPRYSDKDSWVVSPLDMTIPRFEVHRIPPLYAMEYLRRLGNENNIPITTPLHEVAIKRGLKFPDSGKIDNPGDYYPEHLIDVVIPRQVSIRDCLNAIVMADPPANWRAIKYQNNKLVLFMDSSEPGYNQEKTLSRSP